MALRQPFFARVADGILGGIAGLIRFTESLVMLISGPLLTVGLGISLVALLTDGALLATQPELLYAWAVSQAVGVDAQLVAAWDKARSALRERKWLPLIGLLILGLALGYVAWTSAQVFALQQSEGISVAQALQSLGMDKSLWLIQRSLLSVILVALSGWNRFHAPAKVQESAEEERTRLEREVQLEPLRAEARRLKLLGAATLARETLATVTGKAEAEPEAVSEPTDKPPTGPGTPTAARPKRKRNRKNAPVLRLPTESAESKVRRVWEPGMSIQTLVLKAGVSHSTASKWAKVLQAERASDGEMAL